jgi:hypothetical protein
MRFLPSILELPAGGIGEFDFSLRIKLTGQFTYAIVSALRQ